MPSLRTVTIGAMVAVGAVVTTLVLADRGSVPSLVDTSGCTAEVDGRRVQIDLEQAENAALITAVSIERGMPARAASIALAAAFQESKLYNIEYGDRDSVGLFQQRPSQGWGTVAQLMDPVYATNAFYDALARIDGYREMAITEAAQAVQRSAYPEAYADHEADGRALASAFTGNSARSLWCDVPGDAKEAPDDLDDAGLVARAAAVRSDLAARFGTLSFGGFEPGGVSSEDMAGAAHDEGRAIDVLVGPIDPENNRRGWALASYLVANADRLDIKTLIFDDQIWRAGSRSGDGWTDYRVPSSARGDRATTERRDHVHVDVFD